MMFILIQADRKVGDFMFEAAPMSAEDRLRNNVPVLYWNYVALEMNRLTHSLGGPQTGPTMSSRALGLLHLAIHDAWFGLSASSAIQPYLGANLPTPPAAAGGSLGLSAQQVAIGGAAASVLDALYRGAGPGISVVARDKLISTLDKLIAEAPFQLNTLDPAFDFGQRVAARILTLLAVQPGQIGAGQGHYEPRPGRYYFRDEPVNPVRLPPIDPDHPERGDKPARIYHGPFYGTTVATFSATDEDALILAPPPRDEVTRPAAERAEYRAALREVKRLGGAANAAGTTRQPNQTVAGYYWAYDGANLIGTPPRLYNQILRTIAWDRRQQPETPLNEDEFVRVFALANTAMADAGKFAWREKFRYEFWRPLSGVREHDVVQGPGWDDEAGSLSSEEPSGGPADGRRDGDPFWESLGAPETNTDKISFKPPFPAYPSGHATFGAACFQIVRLYYKDRDGLGFGDHACDEISFSFVSDELDGHSRDLRQAYVPDRPIDDQPGTVRTRMDRTFPSLWHAIFENAISRIFLGVHWRFDAFKATDAMTNATSNNAKFKDPCDIDYDLAPGEMVGGVPLGLAIADQIWAANMMPAPPTAAAMSALQPPLAGSAAAMPQVQSANTNIR